MRDTGKHELALGATRARTRSGRSKGRPYAFFLPAFVLVALTSFLPLGYAIQQSFYRSDFLLRTTFVGLGNYVAFFTSGNGLHFLERSFVYVLGTVFFSTVIGSVFALLLNREIKFRGFYRTVLMLPWVVSQLIAALLWSWVLNGRFGPFTELFGAWGIPSLTTSPDWAMTTLIQVNTWRAYPLILVFMLAALQVIPKELLEAAKIDGASARQTLSKIVFPLIKSTLMVSVVLTSLDTFNMVTLILVLTGGGPAGSTDVLALQVFKEAFQFFNIGIASASAVIIFGLNIVFTLVYMRVLRMERMV